MIIVLLRRGMLLRVMSPAHATLPMEIISALHNVLTYDTSVYMTPYSAYEQYGEYAERYTTRELTLYWFENGAIVTVFGFLNLICETLRRLGCDVRYLDNSIDVNDSVYTPDWANLYTHFAPHGTPPGARPVFRPRQEEALAAVANNVYGIVQACTGFGKTFVFQALCLLYPRAKIDIIVRPRDVAERIYQSVGRYVSNTGMIGGGHADRGRVTVYTADSLHLSTYDADIVICDECHQLAADDAFRAICTYKHARIYGFTATPEGRTDGADLRTTGLFGPVIFQLLYREGVSLGLVVPVIVRWLTIRLKHNPGASASTAAMRERLNIFDNEERNRIIAEDFMKQPDEKQSLLMCRSLQHALNLQKLMPGVELCYAGVSAERVEKLRRDGVISNNFIPITTHRREYLRAAFEAGDLRKCIATDVWATGVDFTQLQVLYRADGRNSRILDQQIPGRPVRLHDGKSYAEVVDTYDVFDYTLAQKSRQRRDEYRRIGYAQEWPQAKFDASK